VLAAAALAGVELDYDKTFSMKSQWKTEEFKAKHPLGSLPVLEDGDFNLSESGAIAEYGKSCFFASQICITPRFL
jgi:elongation factor 1-gamma